MSNDNSSYTNFSPVQYNYNVNVNAETNASANDIANIVVQKMSMRDKRSIRGTRING